MNDWHFVLMLKYCRRIDVQNGTAVDKCRLPEQRIRNAITDRYTYHILYLSSHITRAPIGNETEWAQPRPKRMVIKSQSIEIEKLFLKIERKLLFRYTLISMQWLRWLRICAQRRKGISQTYKHTQHTTYIVCVVECMQLKGRVNYFGKSGNIELIKWLIY